MLISLYMGLVGANAQVNNGYDVNGDGHVNITDVSQLITYILGQTTPIDNAPCEAIDLGLPSGTKWASCNVGATKPEEYGGYYAWGETEAKDTYSWENYVHCNGTKATCHDIGSDISVTEYDVAHVNWGGNWRMPTMAEYQELVDNCTSEWITLNGINGCKFTSNINGNSIFLPAAGYRWGNDSLYVDERGYYWSSSQVSTDMSISYDLGFVLGDIHTYWRNVRGGGRSVRPVESPNNAEIIDQNDENGYDMNDDGDVNITDVILLVNYILGLNNGNPGGGGNETNAPGEAIDLGLPSGTKWASCNVGATKPEEFGGYYAWGETEEKDYYSPRTYKYAYQTEHNASIQHENDFTDRDTGIWYAGSYIGFEFDRYHDGWAYIVEYHIEGTEYDVAHMRWGGSWCMPTPAQVSELIENCTSERITFKGVYGCKFTSKINGNSIFLPAAGHREYGNKRDEEKSCNYWSTEFRYPYHGTASFWSPPYGAGSNEYRYYGLSVRPVWKE